MACYLRSGCPPGTLIEVLTLGHGDDAAQTKRSWSIEGKQVCFTAFCNLLGVGEKRIVKLIKGNVDLRRNHPGCAAAYRPCPQSIIVSKFFAELYQSAAEPLPDFCHDDDAWLDSINVSKLANDMQQFDGQCPASFQLLWNMSPGLEVRYLPPGHVHDIYLQYLAWHDDHSLYGVRGVPDVSGVAGASSVSSTPAAWGTFWNVWKLQWHKLLRFRKTSQHTRCSTCFNFEQKIHGSRVDVASKLVWVRELRKHLRDQYADRCLYWGTRWASRQFMDILTIIIDSMDKSKFGLPRFDYHRMPKFLEPLIRPRLVCTAAIAHGWCTSMFLADEQVSHGANAFADILLRVLEKVYQMCQTYKRPFPKHIWIQSDNTVSQAKNGHTANLMGLLVGRFKFHTSNLCYLPVGHTHEDVDQLFGVVAQILSRQKTFQDPADVKLIVQQGLQERIEAKGEHLCVEILDEVRNFKTWLGMTGVTPHHAFGNRDGVEAPRAFSWKLRLDLTSAERAMLPQRGNTGHQHDVFCLVKQSMHLVHLMQPPVLAMPAARCRRVAELPDGMQPRIEYTHDREAQLRKLAEACEYVCGMPKAAAYIRSLVSPRIGQPPPSTAWLCNRSPPRLDPVTATGSPDFPHLPDAKLWRMKVRFSS